MFVITYNLLTLKNTQGDKVQNEANNEKSQEQGGSAGVRGGHPGSDTAVIADVAPPPAVEINGIVRKLAKTAQRPKPLARPELKIVTPGKELPVPPSAMSLRAKCPPVLDQDPIESCAAFALRAHYAFFIYAMVWMSLCRHYSVITQRASLQKANKPAMIQGARRMPLSRHSKNLARASRVLGHTIRASFRSLRPQPHSTTPQLGS